VGAADADLIIASALVEIKATGSPELKLRDLQQVVCYALLDTDDHYQLVRKWKMTARV